MNDLMGQTIRGYEILETIGQGGFGAVYRAFQPSIAREVAIKVILPSYANQPEFIRRFETEAQLVARLEHPFVVPLFDYWRDPEGAYLVMRLIRGGSLRNLLDQERLSFERAISILEQVTGALAVAHRNNVIHRDLKPDNILLDEEGNAYLADFGIAKVNKAGRDEDEEEGIAGSPGYMSPEQITLLPVTPQTDIYSLGVILFELMTGQHPFPDSSTTELIFKQLQEPLPDLSLMDSDLPLELNNVIQRATAKMSEDRYPDVMSLVNDVKAALAGDHTINVVDTAYISPEELALIVNPYKGLRPFEESDASDFFGREALVTQLLDRLRPPIDVDALPDTQKTNPLSEVNLRRFLAVVGPSGSGKSSVVKAGLLPMLRWGEYPGSENWFIVEMVPGLNPLEQLADALRRVAIHTPENLVALLRSDSRGLVNAVRGILPSGSELLLVIDQFEEVFTLLEDEAERTHFLNLIRTAVTQPDSTLRVIITLRADFYDRPLLYEGFGHLMRLRTEVVLPLSAEELERAITGPAERVGLEVEANLLAAIVGDVREEPGALPLLQYVLTEVFERREGRMLTLYGYQSSGGALGALARRADELFQAMDNTRKAVTRQLFLRLVTLGEGTEDTRRRVQWAELMAIGGDKGLSKSAATPTADSRTLLQHVLDTFGKYRLLSFDRDPSTREPTVEVAHEALIREWQRLREWLAESRDDVRHERNLARAAGEWDSAKRDKSYLLTEARLANTEEWANKTDLALTDLEREFLRASIERHDAQLAEVARQQADKEAGEARTLELERENAARLKILAVVLAVACVGALMLTAFALVQQQTAQQERDNARAQQVIAERESAVSRSLALSASASQLESVGSRELALALALDANRMESPPETAQRTLALIAYAPGMVRRFNQRNETDTTITGHTAPINDIAYSPNGTRLVTGGDDGRVILWDGVNGNPVRVMEGHGGLPVTNVAFLPDGNFAVSGSWDLSLILWNLDTGEAVGKFVGHRGVVSTVAISPDGTLALSGSTDGIILWDIATQSELRRFITDEGVDSIAISPDGLVALSGSQTGMLTWWNLETGDRIQANREHTSAVLSVTVAPDGLTALSTSRDGSIVYWNMATGAVLRRLTGDSLFSHSLAVNNVSYSHDGKQALTASDDGSILLWNLATGRAVRRFAGANGIAHEGAINNVAFNPQDFNAVSVGEDAGIILWDVRGGADEREYAGLTSGVIDVAFSAGGGLIFASGERGTLMLWDRTTGESVRQFMLPEDVDASTTLTSAAFSPDSTLVAAALDNFEIVVWQVDTGAIIARLRGDDSALLHTDAINDLAFSPDGTKIVSAASDDLLILWDITAQRPLSSFVGHTRRVFSVAYSPDGMTILSGGGDRLVNVWDVATGEIIHTLTGHDNRVRTVVYSPDGSTAYSGSDDTNIIVWDLVSGTELRRFEVNVDGVGQTVLSIAISRDGGTAISGAEDGSITLWDTSDGQPIRRFLAYRAELDESRSQVTSVAFNPDGDTAVSGLRDGRVILWSTPTLNDLITWTGANRYIPELTCLQRQQYGVTPLCSPDIESSGDAPVTLTP